MWTLGQQRFHEVSGGVGAVGERLSRLRSVSRMEPQCGQVSGGGGVAAGWFLSGLAGLED